MNQLFVTIANKRLKMDPFVREQRGLEIIRSIDCLVVSLKQWREMLVDEGKPGSRLPLADKLRDTLRSMEDKQPNDICSAKVSEIAKAFEERFDEQVTSAWIGKQLRKMLGLSGVRKQIGYVITWQKGSLKREE